MKRDRLKSVLLFLFLVVLGLLAIFGNFYHTNSAKYVMIIIGSGIIVIAAFNCYLWRLPVFRGWLVTKPDLNGTWIAMIRTDWIHPETGERPEAHQDYMAFWQTYFSISSYLMTNISQSEVWGATLTKNDKVNFTFSGIYYNNPKGSLMYEKQRHYGGIILSLSIPREEYKGTYCAQSGTTGTIELTTRKSKLCDSFLECQKLFGVKS